MYEAVWLVERHLIQGEVVERLERDRVHRRLNLLDQLERISVLVWSAAANFLSNPAAPLRQRPDAGPKQECKVCDFLGTETSSDSSHQGASLISTSLRYFLATGDCLYFLLFVKAGSLCCDCAALKKMFMEVWLIKPTAFIRPVGTV